MHYLLWLQTALANDILLPSFTPVTLDDFAVAERLERDFLVALRNQNLSVVSPLALMDEYPDVAIGCAETPECPQILLQRDGSKVLVVASVSGNSLTTTESTVSQEYHIVMKFFGTGNPSLIDVKDVRIADSEVDSFLIAMAQDVSVLLQLLPQQEAPPEPIIIEKIVEPDSQEDLNTPPPDDRRIMRLPMSAQAEYKSQRLGPDEWLEAARVRSGNITLELFSGAVFGDVTHRYDTRIGFDNAKDNVFGIYEYDAFLPGYGAIFGGAIGFMPTWWLEISVAGGAALVQKELSTGWELHRADEVGISTYPYDPVMAGYGELEPRLRFYVMPTGPVKPYVLLGSTMRFYDGYVVQDEADVDYRNRPGGMHAGIMSGGGFAFDSASPIGVFAEIPWTYMLNQTAYESAEGEQLTYLPERSAEPTNMMTKVRVGMTLRFR
ncbi:MAG: hypothetical protein ACON4U_01275 [Myxococcota bacterium]